MLDTDNNVQEELERFNSTEDAVMQDYYVQSQEQAQGKAIPFVNINDADELEISSEAMTLLD